METIWLNITAGSGPEECAYVCALTLKVLLNDITSRADIKLRIIESEPGREKGNVRSVLIALEGRDVKTYADSWIGSIQWIWRSKYRPQRKRKNWFIQINQYVESPSEESFSRDNVRFETARSGGPGGQYVNKTESAVRVIHTPTGKSATARGERSQLFNKRTALAKLSALLTKEQQDKKKQSRAKLRHGHWELVRGNPVRTYDAETLRLLKSK